MPGMKEGTGSDPFATDVVDEDADPDEPDDPEPEATSEAEAGSGVPAEAPRSEQSQHPSKAEIPFIYRRKNVTEGRSLHSFYLRDRFDTAETECREAVEERLGAEVPKADLREAALLYAYRNPQAIADELRGWGYDLE